MNTVFLSIKHFFGGCYRKTVKAKKRITAFMRRLFLKNRAFTIISDNCWGGFVYQRYNLQYRTPTIGLFFYPPDYIKFLERIEYYLSLDLVVVDRTKSIYKSIKPERKYPVGILGDIEIQFLHYSTAEEAIKKWNDRKKRINLNNCLIKMSNRSSMFSSDYYERFEKLPFKHKILFTKDDIKQKDCIYIEEFSRIMDTNINEIPYTLKRINLRKLLNGLYE